MARLGYGFVLNARTHRETARAEVLGEGDLEGRIAGRGGVVNPEAGPNLHIGQLGGWCGGDASLHGGDCGAVGGGVGGVP